MSTFKSAKIQFFLDIAKKISWKPRKGAWEKETNMVQQKKESLIGTPYKKLAATYFSTNKCSIIGDVRLNFSVRNGKR